MLGEGKTLSGGERAEAILQRYREDLPAFADYTRSDARLALQIVERLTGIQCAADGVACAGKGAAHGCSGGADIHNVEAGEVAKLEKDITMKEESVGRISILDLMSGQQIFSQNVKIAN